MPAFTIKPKALSPFVRFAARICHLFGILLVHPNGDNTKPASRGYATVTAALAAWTSGKLVVVCPGTYAENVTAPDRARIILLGATLGTADAASVAIASPSGGEVAYVQGWGTLEGTVGSLAAAAGAHLALGPGVDLAGAWTGVYRIGRTWYLPSGEAIATYCPADGSVVAVVAGDILVPHPDDTDGEHFSCVTVAGTTRWVGDPRAINIGGVSSSGSGTTYCTFALPTWATGIFWDSWEVVNEVSATNDASHNWTFGLTYDGAVLDSWTTWDPVQQTADRFYSLRRAIGAYTAALTTGADRGATQLEYLFRTKNNSPGNIWYQGGATYRPVIS